jgi:PAS domain S-box-containing protein
MEISGAKHASADLSNDEKLFRLLVASVKDYAIFMLDAKGHILTWNQGAENIKGYSEQEIAGRHFSIFYTKEDRKKNAPQHNLTEAVAKGSYESEGLRVRKDGSLFWANVVITALYNEDQQLTGFAKITRDITERKKDEDKKAKFAAELEELNLALKEKITVVVEHQNQTIQKIQEFTFLADSIPQIIWTSQPDGHVDYYNKHWFEYTGMTPEQTQGWGWEPVLHPEDLDNCVKVWTESLKTGKPYEIEYRFKRAGDSSYRWHLGRALPMRNEKHEIIKWFGSCTDIDEYKRALDLERKIGQFEDFNRIVAHNLRGPAGNMGTILDMMENTPDENARIELLSLLKRSNLSLNQTLEQLMKVLDIRLNRGIPYENCELQDILSGVQKYADGPDIF